MYTKKTEYTLEQLIVIFIEERKKLQYLFLEQMGRMGISRECIDYMFEKWIESAENCKTEDEFDHLLKNSLRMSFQDWFTSL